MSACAADGPRPCSTSVVWALLRTCVFIYGSARNKTSTKLLAPRINANTATPLASGLLCGNY
eukprot:4339186-Alexandrium_andersonii.AAC.1